MIAPVSKAGRLFGYARVSTTDQDLALQEAALRAAAKTGTMQARF